MTSTQREGHGDSQDSAMEFLGYSKLQVCLVPSSTVAAVKRSLRQQHHIAEEYAIYGRGNRKACEDFLKYGIEGSDALDRKIREVIGTPAFPLQQGPVIIHAPQAVATWGVNTAHPTRRGVSIFRTLASENDKHVSITLYPASHHLSSREFFNGEKDLQELQLQADEILVVQGALRMEVTVPADGWLAWQGYSELPWGLDPSSSEVFPFMRI